MAKTNTKIVYDEEEDILSLSKNRKVKASIDIGDFIIDIDHKGYVTGIGACAIVPDTAGVA